MTEEEKLEKFDEIKKLEEEYDKQQAIYKAEGMEEHDISTINDNDNHKDSLVTAGIKTGVKKVKNVKEEIFGDMLPF